MLESFAPLDILILAAIAGVVVYRLYRQFGTRVDVDIDFGDSGGQDSFSPRENPSQKPDTSRPLFSPNASSPTPDAESGEDTSGQETPHDRFGALKALDPDFDEKTFLEGASIAFDMVINGVANGQVKEIKPLLGKELFDEFCADIKQRKADGHEHRIELIGIDNMQIRDIQLDDTLATLTVEIDSQQIMAVFDSDNNLIDGDAEELQDMTDFWKFQRDMSSENPNWKIVAIDDVEDED